MVTSGPNKMTLTTEGVLVVASSAALRNAYADQEFDYRFPEGLDRLLSASSIVALTTSDCDELDIEVQLADDFPTGEFDRQINQHLIVGDNDDLLVLSHAAFTMICDNHNGDQSQYPWPVNQLATVPAGTYKVNVNIDGVADPEDDDFLAGYRVLIVLIEVPEIRWANRVEDFTM